MPEGIDIEQLGERLRRTRRQRRLTLREVARVTNISVASLSRIERGAAKEIETSTLLALTRWLGTTVEKLQGKVRSVTAGDKLADSTPDIVDLHLRADKNLDHKTAAALARMFRTAYEQLAKDTQKG